MLQHAEDNGGDDPERVYTIQLRPKDPDPARNFGPGYGWAYALGRKAGNNHDRLSWNEQAAIVITVRLSVSFPLGVSISFCPSVFCGCVL